MPYRVQAQHKGHIVSQIRLQAASAIGLATEWTNEGRQVIVIVTQDGRTHGLKEAQHRRAQGFEL